MERHEWLDRGRYPFQSRFATVEGAEIHYLDEGTGRPLVFLHGNPTWNFLYRHLINQFRESHRCLALDWPGFGLSAKPESGKFRPANHASTLHSFLDRLEIDEYDLVVHDWGGPIGLDVASKHPERLGKIIVFNSWPGPIDSLRVRGFSYLMRSPLGRMTTQWNLFPYFMWLGVHKRSQFRSRALPYYLSPFKSGSRRGIRTLAGALTLETDWLETVETRAQRTLSESPALILWGMRDPVLSPTLIKRWEDVLPDVETRRIDDAGHFVPEDVDNDYNDLIETFLG